MNFHYGIDSVAFDRPAMIVVHYTAIASLADSLTRLKLERLSPDRTDIAGHGDVNVSVHYLIAGDGTIYRLQQENIACRHVIGFNWCALGIEMVAANEKQLTPAQLVSCAWLCAWIASRLSSVDYLIGHHEYAKKKLPHFAFYKENYPTYKPVAVTDPGDVFMKKLRAVLSTQFSIILKD
jgi:N-acetyl-anhydromuramyl-L-alanine amidase AmpD